jgi:hypothetical protein
MPLGPGGAEWLSAAVLDEMPVARASAYMNYFQNVVHMLVGAFMHRNTRHSLFQHLVLIHPIIIIGAHSTTDSVFLL